MSWRIFGSSLFYLSFLLLGCAGCYLLAQWSGLPTLAIISVTLIGLGTLFLGQRLWPYRQDWRHWKSELVIDVLHGLFSTIAVSAVLQATLVGLVFWFA